jgi:hypothetical protein
MKLDVASLLQPFAAWRERRYATHAAAAALSFYHRLRAKEPALVGSDLYESVVCLRNGIAASDAHAILHRARESFAAWPIDRDLIFRDVVQYLVISEYLVAKSKRVGTAINMADVVAQVIPKEF